MRLLVLLFYFILCLLYIIFVFAFRKEESSMEIDEQEQSAIADKTELNLRDEVKRLTSIKLKSKPKSFHLVLGNGGELRIVVNSANNSLDLFTLSTTIKDTNPVCLRCISNQGHRTEVRAVAFSSDNLAVVSGSGESIKMWNRPTQSCLRTINTG